MQVDRRLVEVVEIFREVYEDMSIRQIVMLLAIAAAGDEGITQTDLSVQYKMPQGSVSRNARQLSRYIAPTFAGGDPEIQGLDLIECRPDLYETRRLNCTLTQKGIALMEWIQEVVNS